jgi:hypothetical protein
MRVLVNDLVKARVVKVEGTSATKEKAELILPPQARANTDAPKQSLMSL